MDYDAVILPTFSQVESWRKRVAGERASGVFAQAVTTFEAWIADLWELHGDGRTMVSGMRREVMMRALSREAGDALATRGIAPLAARVMAQAAGLDELERTIAGVRRGEDVAGLSAGEVAFVGLLARYEDLLESQGLVELGQAAAMLSRGGGGTALRPMRVLADDEVLDSWVAARFLGKSPVVQLAVARPRGGDAPGAPQGVELRFAFPSGALAQAGIIADVVRERGGCGDVVVACKDPLKMYGQCEAQLAREGARVAVQASKPFAQTDFGRAYLALFHCLHDDPFDPSLLADSLVWPFSGFSRAQVVDIDTRLRGDRLADRETEVARLRVESERFSQLEELAGDPEADVLIGVFEQVAQAAPGRTPAWRAEQLAAMGALKGAMAAARGIGADIGTVGDVLGSASVRVSFSVEGSGHTALFTTQEAAAHGGEGSCSTLVAADLTAESYPVSERDDAGSTLLGKLGLTPRETALGKARRTFASLLRAPTELVVLVRPLGDAAADATYPTAALGELVDALAAVEPGGAEPDKRYQLPSGLLEGVMARGEEDLYANACALPPGSAQALSAEVPRPRIDEIGDDEARKCAPRAFDSQGRLLDKPCPSPSQIEDYLACPFQWFVSRRVKLDELDEGFGALQRGAFAHAALEAFYRRFRESGHPKVNGGNLDEAHALMRDVLAGLERVQFDGEHPPENRLVPRTELERREVAALCRQLEGYLDFEARLLPTFHPAYLEYAIEADDPADYAGAYLVGKVDRIDVDDEGHAVIIDYKGSVNDAHEIKGKDALDAGKVQTRIYAQAVKRRLGLDVVGALYVTYGRSPVVSGCYDRRVLDAVHLPGADPKKCGCNAKGGGYDLDAEGFSFGRLSFADVLDATEDLAARAVEGMCSGEISPNPSNAGACRHCPVLGCPKRGA